jgi:hypothetical protein
MGVGVQIAPKCIAVDALATRQLAMLWEPRFFVSGLRQERERAR